MRVLICGSRNWTNVDAIRREMVLLPSAQHLPSSIVVIEGEASGADSLARDIAIELGFTVEPYPADWKRYGRAAGPIRNTQMLREGRPELVLAFSENIEVSRGTRNMVEQARKAGITVKVFKE